MKSWLYQDCLEKPNELVLYRSSEDGGLGLFNVKLRALALLIRSFLETAVNPTFSHSLFHEILFRYHILGEVSLPDPGLPPYYDKEFFEVIRHYHFNSPMNVETMSTREWYRALLEDKLLMTAPVDQSPPQLIPVRVESLHPTNDWAETWRLARINGLASNLASFLFRMIHCLLPTQDCVQRLGVADGGQPGQCRVCHQEVEDTRHALYLCPHSMVAGHALLGYVQKMVPNITPEDTLKLNIGAGLQAEEELATVCMLATGWMYIWEARVDKKQVTLFKMRAELEAIITILRKSRHRLSGDIMLGMMN